MKQYLDLANYVLKHGVRKVDRTGTGTFSIFGYQMRFNLGEGFPLLTTKKVHFPAVVHELLWFLKGDTNIQYLKNNNIKIWNEWADENGELGRIYGKQWRQWEHIERDERGNFMCYEIDQIKEVIEEIKVNPNSRRLIVNAWNVGDFKLGRMSLPPCHLLFQFNVTHNKLNCQLYQRSCDIFLGCPFNIASYSLLLHMIAQVCNLEVGEFVYTIGDGHIYLNHVPQILTQMQRTPKILPKLILDKSIKNIDDFTYDSIKLVGYNPHPRITGEVSI